MSKDASELDLFYLFVDDNILDQLVTATKDYAEKPKQKKTNIGCLLLLSINSV